MAELFGFTIARKKQDDQQENLPSIVSPTQDDGAVEVAPGGAYGTYVDLEGKAKNEGELVTKYRQMVQQPECDSAVQDVVNEAIVITEDAGPVNIVLDNLDYPESIKKKITEEFEALLKMLDFNNTAYDTFRKWYIDGRLYYHIVIDEKNPRQGIKDLRYIDPRKIRKIREPIKEKDKRTGVTIYKGTNEYYLYNQGGMTNANQTQGVKIAKDSIAYCHSGLLDERNSMVHSYLHKAIKPLNQLRMLEDAVVIYRLARAPERRVFYIDVGNLPKMKAEQYMRDMMVKHKNKLIYDASTGEVRDDRKFMTMLEDFWLPRREGGRGTEITTLPGGQNLGEMDDVDYFRRKLYKSLGVPITRMEAETQFNLGRSSEITRDEVKFNKFVMRLRARFSILFDELLEIQLALKGVITRAEWKEMKQDIHFDYQEDNHFTELKDTEIMQGRLQILGEIDGYVGRYFSGNWVRKNVLRMTEEDIKNEQKQIDQEESEAPDEEDPDAEEKEEPRPIAQTEAYEPPEEISDEEKELIERMTEFIDGALEED
jgi:hypothetical protein|tara:strand:+ start:622 stop:2244 length:1623 start_codon:yes stop_codon:yes gene_type:complete